jgi:hypothetical protein
LIAVILALPSGRRLAGFALLAASLAIGVSAAIRGFSPLAGADACEAAVRDARSATLAAASGAGGAGASRASLVSRACAPLFVEPACRTAHERFDRPPPYARAVTLAEACRDAYCPLLPPPRPGLCDAPPSALPPAELAKAWSEFVPVVLAHDHGARAAHVIETFRAPH